MRKYLALAVVLGFFASGALAQVFESEPNDTFETAQWLPDDFFGGYNAGAVEGYLDPGNVDYYAVYLPADVLVTASVWDYTPDDDYDNDSMLGVFSPDGALFDYNDDTLGYLSGIEFYTPVAGMWRVAVTGYGDDDFDGTGQSEDFDYRLVMSIPEPASLGMLLVGLGFLARRR